MSSNNNPFDLPLGSAAEELREYVRKPLQTDEFRTGQLQSEVRKLQLLEQIALNTGSTQQSPPKVGDQPGTGGGGTGGGSPQQGPHYWATEETITVDSPLFEVTSWGFPADTVVLLFDGDLRVAFSDPAEENTIIPLTTAESPFSIAGIDGLWASEVQYALPEGAAATTTVDLRIIAVD